LYLPDIRSVCFASLYRIITITHLVRTSDISWAKSDVFIWSSVEPSIGIISGCLPTLRPLLVKLVGPWRNFLPSSKKSSSSGSKSSRAFPLNTIETISKKRTRKIKKNELDSLQFTQLEDEVEVKGDGTVREPAKVVIKRDYDDSGNWRPDDDEMCLTTTTVHRSESEAGLSRENRSVDSLEREGITMTRRFEWDETRHS
jgi:hypothetical protein